MSTLPCLHQWCCQAQKWHEDSCLEDGSRAKVFFENFWRPKQLTFWWSFRCVTFVSVWYWFVLVNSINVAWIKYPQIWFDWKNQLWMSAGYGSDIASESRFFVMTCNDYLTFKSQPTWKPVLHKRENFQREHEQLPKDSSSRNIRFDSLTDAECTTSVAACMAMIRCQLETQQTKKRWKWIEPTIGIVSLGTYYRHLLTMDCPNIKAVPRYHCAYYMLWSHANTHGFGIPPSINCFPASNGAGFPTTLETWNSYAFRMPAIKWASSYACQLAAEAWYWP